ncbi:MAG TPA: dTDP-4-dehydrorhamnose reductase [Chitinophagaceae bacterium]|jgi:dTDP-4-dehydrorhamnose reductase|nr:dTDP-4-dehydrorhamnose reductase [Chitinophagaceae bacterium]
MKIAVIGANGQLGSDLVLEFSSEHQVTSLTHDDIEITNIDNVKKVLSTAKPEILINTAAYNKVPEAEKFPEEAFRINALGTLNLAKICQDEKIRFLHYSTDYVFDGKKLKHYIEDDLPNPLNVYGNTKLSGEYFALNYCEHSFVVRVSGIYGKVPSRSKGSNFISSILKLAAEKPEVKVVNDEVLTPTSTLSIAKNTKELIQTEAYGLYHMSCEGEVSWYEFAKTIWTELNIKTPLYPVSVKDFPQVVKRPFYSVLENFKLKALGINKMPDWKEALLNFLK